MDKIKRIFYFLMAITLIACEKDTAPETTVLEIRTEDPTNYGRKSVTLNGSISDPDAVQEAGFLFWKTEDKDHAIDLPCEEIGDQIFAVADGLITGESYVYCCYVGNGINRMMGQTKSFRTPTIGVPLISKPEWIDERTVRAQIWDDGIDESGSHIVAKGFCWNTTGRPTVFDQKIVINNEDSFEAQLPGIQSNTDVYIRAFAQNDSSYLAYGPENKIYIERKGINSLDELRMFKDELNNEEDISSWLDNGTVYLNCDIDMSELPGFYDFSIDYCDFVFEGNNHTIKINAFYPNGYEEDFITLGLFKQISEKGIVRNLNIDYTGQNYGVLYIDKSANIGNIAGHNWGTIENCTSHKTSFYVGPEGKYTSVGGICAYNSGTIENCTNYGDITGSWLVGGICAVNWGIIKNCRNFGNISNIYHEDGDGDCTCGIAFSSNGIIHACENHGDITGESAWNSGIGSTINSSYITECINFGNVKGYCNVAGISAEISDSTIVEKCTNNGDITLLVSDYNHNKSVGGIASYVGYITNETATSGIILNCKNTAHITDETSIGDIGNIAGVINVKGKVEGCIYGGTVNGATGTRENAIGRIETGGSFKSLKSKSASSSTRIPFQFKE
ncbi:MAG: hypothetical protein J6K31_10560 [Parabacteroides sp.]|nr:hypothetical protein [Parabacteroides sp.]